MVDKYKGKGWLVKSVRVVKVYLTNAAELVGKREERRRNKERKSRFLW